MSLIGKIKSAFGFGNDEKDDLQPESFEVPMAPPQIDTDKPIEVSEEIMIKIFDKVVEVTNASLPGYLASSVNTEKQKKYLYDSLDQSVKQYLADLDAKSQAKCMALWQNDRDELTRQMDSMKQRAADLEAKRNEVNEQKLSIENQRRALNERVRVLEQSVMKLEAEKEQLEIENRGLINKAKVAQVLETDMDSMRQELELLRASVSPEATSEEIEKLQAEISRLQSETIRLGSQIESLEQVNEDLKESNDSLTEANDSLTRTNEDLTQTNEDLLQANQDLTQANDSMKESCEAAKMKSGMSDVMLKDLQKRTAELVQTVKEAEQTTASLTDELAVKDAKIADLHQIIEEKEARLAENEEMFEELSALSEQMTLFEDVKNRLQKKILSLKEELKQAHAENESLRSTIELNLDKQALNEQAMQHTIQQLRNNQDAPLTSEDLSIDSDAL